MSLLDFKQLLVDSGSIVQCSGSGLTQFGLPKRLSGLHIEGPKCRLHRSQNTLKKSFIKKILRLIYQDKQQRAHPADSTANNELVPNLQNCLPTTLMGPLVHRPHLQGNVNTTSTSSTATSSSPCSPRCQPS